MRVDTLQIKNQPQSRLTLPGTYSLLLACGWTFVIAASLLVSISVQRKDAITIAQNVARAYIDKDILYRNWNVLHGGIYVPTDRGISPNPFYPPSVLERDVTTPSGRHLTLVNPSYMTRQIYDLAQFGVAQFYPDDIAETFIKRADDAMYAAKQAGRIRVETRCDCQTGTA